MKELLRLIHFEYKQLLRNSGALLVIILAPLAYSLLYSAGYSEQVLHKVPVTVVDNSHSYASRRVIQTLNASPYISIVGESSDMESAKSELFERSIYGIIYIPEYYEQRVLQGKVATISLYCDGSYFLMYRQLFQGVASVIAAESKRENVVTLQSHTLFNPYLGYGTFIMPAVLLVILQQTTIIGIGIMGALWSRKRLYRRWSTSTIVVAKLTVYSSIAALIASYILAIHYHIFGYPAIGSTAVCAAITVPYLLSIVALGIALSTLFKCAETPVIAILWSSIPVLLVTGASLPQSAFPWWMHTIGKLLPSTSAVPAYIRAQVMGASIEQVEAEVLWLWGLTALYLTLATVAIYKKTSARPTTNSEHPPVTLL